LPAFSFGLFGRDSKDGKRKSGRLSFESRPNTLSILRSIEVKYLVMGGRIPPLFPTSVRTY